MSSEEFTVEAYADAMSFLDKYRPEQIGCLLLDIKMPGLKGLELQLRLEEMEASLPIIFLTGHANIPKTVQAFKYGAFDFLQKPAANIKPNSPV